MTSSSKPLLMEHIDITKFGYTVLQLETRSSCNMACSFCPYPLREDKGNVMPEEVVYKVIDSLTPNNNFEYLCFSHFNEPLMDKRIYDFIAYAREKGIPTLLITNGLLFRSDEIVEKMAVSAPDNVKISLQTVNAKLYRNVRGVKGSFGDYKMGIFKYLQRASGTTSSIAVDVACNFLTWHRYLMATVLGLEKGDPSVYNSVNDLKEDIRSFLSDLHHFDNSVIFDIALLDEFLSRVNRNYFNDDGFRLKENILLKIKPFMQGDRLTRFYPVKNAGCQNRMLGILADGNVVPCCLVYDDTLSMGNVQKDSLQDILARNIPLLNRIRQGNNLPAICQKCLGSPTRRGAVVKTIKNALWKK